MKITSKYLLDILFNKCKITCEGFDLDNWYDAEYLDEHDCYDEQYDIALFDDRFECTTADWLCWACEASRFEDIKWNEVYTLFDNWEIELIKE